MSTGTKYAQRLAVHAVRAGAGTRGPRGRGLVALAASGVIAALMYFGLATPYPELKIAYLICVGVGVWGLIGIVWSLGAAGAKRD
jgi:hypothetical protein